MANKYSTLSGLFGAIANALRSKTGTTAAIVADNFPTVIESIEPASDLASELSAQDSLISQISTAVDNKVASYPLPVFKVDAMSGGSLGTYGYGGSQASQSITKASWTDIHTISNASTYSKPFWCVYSNQFGAGVITEYDTELVLYYWSAGQPQYHTFRIVVESNTIKFQGKAWRDSTIGYAGVYGALK